MITGQNSIRLRRVLRPPAPNASLRKQGMGVGQGLAREAPYQNTLLGVFMLFYGK
jgi:hypothetical protein